MERKDKETRNLIDEKAVNRPLGIEHRLQFLEEKIEKSIKKGKQRFANLLEAIDKEYPRKTPIRGSVDGFTAIIFDTAFELYFIGNNSALFVELQGIIERFCYNELCDVLPINDKSQGIIIDSFDKKTLKDFAPYMEKLGLWNESDVKFAQKLTNIRNGITHKNVKIVSKYLFDGKQEHIESIHDITAKTDCIPYIIGTINLIIKAMKGAEPSFVKNPRLKARYERYLPAIGAISSMFCFPEFMNLPKSAKELHLLNFFAPLYLIAGEELSNELNNFHSKISEFHANLYVNDKKATELHALLSKSAKNIGELMRKEMEIDAEKDIFEDQGTPITMEEIKRKKKEKGKK